MLTIQPSNHATNFQISTLFSVAFNRTLLTLFGIKPQACRTKHVMIFLRRIAASIALLFCAFSNSCFFPEQMLLYLRSESKIFLVFDKGDSGKLSAPQNQTRRGSSKAETRRNTENCAVSPKSFEGTTLLCSRLICRRRKVGP